MKLHPDAQRRSRRETMFKVLNGDPAPAIDLTDTHGERWQLSDHHGKMVVLHFGRGEY
jgi:peroxiredoxin